MADALYGVLTLLAVCTLATLPLVVVLPSSPPMFDNAMPPPSTPESDRCPMSSAQQPPTPGDLAFFRGDPHNRIDALIMRRTSSPWVHVGVIIEHGLMLSARSDGVRIEPLPISAAGAMIASTGAHLGERDAALTWLLQQAGNAYGFGDILNQALTWLNAQLPGWIDLPTLSFARHKDCSHVALDFLRIGGYPFSASAHIAVLQPERVTPGTLASILPLSLESSVMTA